MTILSSKLKIGLGIVVIFVAGLLCGGMVAGKMIAAHIARSLTFENFTRHMMGELDKKLALSAEQKPKVEAIVRSTQPEFKGACGEFGNILVRMHDRVDRELTPEQQKIHAAMLAEAAKALKEKMGIELPTSTDAQAFQSKAGKN